MLGLVVSAIIGVVCILIGVSNRKGNISSLHSYHRNRVREEDVLPYGKKIGLGMIIIGISIIAFSIISYISEATKNDIFALVGTGVMLAGILVGSIILFKAMIKYNKGIF